MKVSAVWVRFPVPFHKKNCGVAPRSSQFCCHWRYSEDKDIIIPIKLK